MKKELNGILFIEPPFYRLFKETYSLNRYPLSLGYLAGVVRKETSWRVMVYNADFRPNSETILVGHMAGSGFDNYLRNLKDVTAPVWDEIKSVISEYAPAVVGITAKSQTLASAINVAKLAKELDERIKVILGGPHVCMVGAEVLKYSVIDMCVLGEGEQTIVDLIGAIDAGKGFEGIPGIIFRENDRIIKNQAREFIENLDSLCFPHETANELLKDHDQYPPEAFSYIFTTRGCPYNCFFCGSRNIWSRKVRFRSPDNVVKEINELQSKGLRYFCFEDDIFGVTRKYLYELCNALIRHCPGIKWNCEIHVKLVDEKTISLMKEAGCYAIRLGIESGNNEILRAMRKDITIEEALDACKIVKKHGIVLHAFFIVGFPQETVETFKDTLDAIKKTKCDLLVYSIFTPYPGTEAFEYCKRNGLIDENYDVSLYNHQSPANCFYVNIAPQIFRNLVSKIEKTVDRRNKLNRLKRIFSKNTIWRMQELGIGGSLKKGLKIILFR